MAGASHRIGIFGGSFNPPHNGHVGACRYVMVQGWVDQLVIIPCLAHPFQKPLAPFADRLAMCRLAFDGVAGVVVSAVEEALGGVSHTVRTVAALQAKEPAANFFCIVGEDLLVETPRWEAIDTLRTQVTFLTLPRGAAGPIPDVSATAIRNRLAVGQSIADLVPPAVVQYIDTNSLYRS